MSYKIEKINTLSEKVTPVSADVLIIEDSADSLKRKKVQVGNLPSVTYPYFFDNTTAGAAVMGGDSADNGWFGGPAIRIFDGSNEVFVRVINFGGGAPTKNDYDAGGGASWSPGLFANVFRLNFDASDLDVEARWEQLNYNYDAVASSLGFTFGTTLFLEHSALTHDLITVEALASMEIFSTAAGDTVTIKGVVFTAVNPGPATAANQEFDDVAAAGSATLCAASLAATINDAASQALLTAAATNGVVITAYDEAATASLFIGSGGFDFSISESTTGGNMTIGTWDNFGTAVTLTPGLDVS